MPSVDLHGDPLPHRALARLGTTRFRMGYPTRSIQAVPARKQIVTNHLDGMLAVWCAESGKLLRLEDEGHQAFAVSADGRMFASARRETIRLWDGQSSETLRVLTGTQCLIQVAFSRHGKYVAAVDSAHQGVDSVRVWEVATGKLVRQFIDKHALAFSRDGDAIVVADRLGHVEHWDLRRDLGLTSFGVGDGTDLACLAVSSDGITLLVDRGRDIAVVDLPRGRVTRWLKGHDSPTRMMFFAPGNDLAVTCSDDQSIGFWRPSSGELLRSVDAWSHCIALSGDGKTVISGGYQGSLRFWNLADGRESVGPSDMARQTGASFATHDRVWTCGIDGGLRQWSADTGKLLGAVPLGSPTFAAAASADNGAVLVAQADGAVRWHHPASGESTQVAQHEGRAFSVALAPDGDLFASGGEDCAIFVGRRSSPESLLRLDGHRGAVLGLGFSPDGRFLASAGGDGDGALCFWSTNSGVLLERATLGTRALTHLVYVASGKRVLAIAGGDVVLWNIIEHKIDRRLGVNGCSSVAVSPCGQFMALGHENGTVRILKRGSEKLVWQSDGHRGEVSYLAYSPDGSRLVSTGDDASAIVWMTT